MDFQDNDDEPRVGAAGTASCGGLAPLVLGCQTATVISGTSGQVGIQVGA